MTEAFFPPSGKHALRRILCAIAQDKISAKQAIIHLPSMDFKIAPKSLKPYLLSPLSYQTVQIITSIIELVKKKLHHLIHKFKE